MQNFQLEVFLHIIGIGAASGLVFTQNELFLISDHSSYLYNYSFEDQKLNKIALQTDASENLSKKDKPDFEAITLYNNQLYIFGSGSTENRNALYIYNLKNQSIRERNIKIQHDSLKLKSGISSEDFNIEGVVYHQNKTLLFQRGNGKGGKNGVFVLDEQKKEVRFEPIDLPKIKGVTTTFTDAVLVSNTIYFLASAEDSNSTFDDGEVMGSIIGSLSPDTFEINFTQQISDTHKFEGITFFRKQDSVLEFLLCEDNDSDVLESTIYKLTLNQ